MRYCTQCGSEYEDSVDRCSDCGGTELVSADRLQEHRRALPHEMDTRRFVRAGTAEDPLTAEQYTAALEAAKIPVFARPRRAGTVDSLTSGVMSPWWEILVPEDHLTQATALLETEARQIDAAAERNARAAEEEAAGTEPKEG
ncbi:MAG: hypothetical protein ACOZIN_18215 [Myxococcota bacterium]